MISALKEANIIYVEDDETIRRPFSKILGMAFKDVYVAVNGQEALDMLNDFKEKNQTIDLIISDVTMPIMDGYELLKTIRESGNDIPFIITTAHGDLKTVSKIREYGVSDYITKPVDMQKLLFKCNDIVKTNKQND